MQNKLSKKNIIEIKKLDEYFKYPFNNKLLSKKLDSEINKLINIKFKKKIKLYILSGSTIGNISEQIKLFSANYGIQIEIKESGYNQYYEEALFGNEIKKFNPDWIYIHTNIKNINYFSYNIDTEKKSDKFCNDNVNKIKKILSSLKKYRKKIIINNFEFPDLKVNNVFNNTNDLGIINSIRKLNSKIINTISNNNNIYLNDVNYLSNIIGINEWIDKNYWAAFKIAFSSKAFPYLSSSISSIIASVEGLSKKVLICDLDDTLWGGIIGDVGFENIKLGPETGHGEIYHDLQKYIKSLIANGIVLSVASKNDERIAKNGFKNKFSILKFDDFVNFKANWERKSDNILNIINDLNLTEESVVFIDDNPAEIDEVKNILPLVTTISYKKSPLELITTIERLGYFNKLQITSDDLKRNKFYKDNIVRSSESKSFSNYEEYLINLKMTAKIEKLNISTFARASQLLNKTNQFNLTQEKNDTENLKNLSKSKNNLLIQSNLKDKYGDNGIISVLYGFKKNKDFYIQNWVLSCRVFKRNLEFAIIDYLTDFCLKNNINRIKVTLIKNEKNLYIYKLFDTLKFNLIEKDKNIVKYAKNINIENIKNKLNSHIVIIK